MIRSKLTLILLLFFLAIWSILASAHGMSEGDKASLLAGGNLVYMQLGASHMLTGYDHLLFIFGIIFFLTNFKEILKYISAFTLGHSITLVFATLYDISANYYLIDAVIALSVCYKGFENLDGFNKYLGIASPNLLLVIFVFGLVHGFGLATRLQQLPLGEEGLIWRILSFNVGVELGQVVALLVMVGVISAWRHSHSFKRFSLYANSALVLAGVVLFLFQIHAYMHSIDMKVFGFESTSQSQVEGSDAGANDDLNEALAEYDRAFEQRDVMALWDLFAEDIVLYEQGNQDLGRDQALGKHVGPDLQAFEQMLVQFSEIRVIVRYDAAIRTRKFVVKGKLPDRFFLTSGYETQNWVLKDGQWKLIHMHWSFPGR